MFPPLGIKDLLICNDAGFRLITLKKSKETASANVVKRET